jgi:imidazolonepropionase-like amidohydrolase
LTMTPGGHTGRTVLRGATVFDGETFLGPSLDVVLADGRILDVGSELDGDDLIDCSGLTMLPGLIDCHVHVVVEQVDILKLTQQPFSYQFYIAAKNLAALRRTGITTARDAGGADLGIKRALEDGLIPGPRLLVALSVLSQTGGHADGWVPSGGELIALRPHPGLPPFLVDGPEQMRLRVRELVRAGADVIKVATTGGVMSPMDDPRDAHFQMDELQMAVTEAKMAGLDVMAHAHSPMGIANAVAAGVRSIEHAFLLDAPTAELMATRGTFLVPTLMAAASICDAAASGASVTESTRMKAQELRATHLNAFALALDAGVPIAMGTDAVGQPQGRNLRELELMVEAGMSPVAALAAATSVAARLLRIDGDRGWIRPGMRADLVLIEGDCRDLRDLGSRVRMVLMDGQVVEARSAAVGED